uniref:E3 ubiquitin-protein ligase NRDP1 n=2 Tax=Lygus hesperus TaxID=30085 RepID=A0A0A9YEL2_LYGHE
MGFEIHRFTGDVDAELLCPICSEVLEEPLQAPACEHAFCSACIHEWISRQPTCPVDRQSLTQLRPVPRILRNLLSRLSITCENAIYGCQAILKLDALSSHLAECQHNPKKPVPCDQGCGMVIPMDELQGHNCVRELRALIDSQQQKIQDFQQEIGDQRSQINELKRELYMMQNIMRAMRGSSPTMRAMADEMERNEVIRWSNSLVRARVTRWGSMISTPDALLQISRRLRLPPAHRRGPDGEVSREELAPRPQLPRDPPEQPPPVRGLRLQTDSRQASCSCAPMR